MDKTTIPVKGIYKEERFRIPSPLERKMGLWIDRMGEKVDGPKEARLRILGQYAVIYVESGAGIFVSMVTGTLSVKAGDTLLHFPDIPAYYSPFKKWKTRWIVWNGPDAARLEKLGYITPNRPIVKRSGQTVTRAFFKLVDIISREDKGAVLERKALVLDMVNILFRRQESEYVFSPSHMQLEKAVRYIQQHYTEPIAITDLAERYNFSPTHFRRLFKEYTGRGPKNFVTSLRISQAKQLLSQGRRIKEVAPAVGFMDEFYFMRIFKKVTGVSPGKFIF